MRSAQVRLILIVGPIHNKCQLRYRDTVHVLIGWSLCTVHCSMLGYVVTLGVIVIAIGIAFCIFCGTITVVFATAFCVHLLAIALTTYVPGLVYVWDMLQLVSVSFCIPSQKLRSILSGFPFNHWIDGINIYVLSVVVHICMFFAWISREIVAVEVTDNEFHILSSSLFTRSFSIAVGAVLRTLSIILSLSSTMPLGCFCHPLSISSSQTFPMLSWSISRC